MVECLRSSGVADPRLSPCGVRMVVIQDPVGICIADYVTFFSRTLNTLRTMGMPRCLPVEIVHFWFPPLSMYVVITGTLAGSS